MTAPVVAFEGSERDRLAPEHEAARSERRIIEKQLASAEAAAARATDGRERQQARTDAGRLARELAECPPEVSPRYWTDNVTPEWLEQMLAEHGGRMAVLSGEADLLDVLAGLYNRGVPNFGVFLRAHSGDDLSVDRVSRGAQVLCEHCGQTWSPNLPAQGKKLHHGYWRCPNGCNADARR